MGVLDRPGDIGIPNPIGYIDQRGRRWVSLPWVLFGYLEKPLLLPATVWSVWWRLEYCTLLRVFAEEPVLTQKGTPHTTSPVSLSI